MKNIDNDHPYFELKNIIEIRKDFLHSVFLSYYSYKPQTVSDVREIHEVLVSDFLEEDFMDEFFNNAGSDREIAFHSCIISKDGEVRHIPMIDMASQSAAHIEKIKNYIGDDLFNSFIWYKSGRSFHGYSSLFLDNDGWQKFMGMLLLVNQKGLAQTVDPRWIGHRLLAGYSALRWTKNTSFYLSIPRQIKS